MDPVTQGVLGAAAAQATLSRKLGKRLWLLGAAGGMAADLDVFIRSSVDPLAHVVWHRHFTHSLAFVPLGGLLVLLPFLFFRVYRSRSITAYLAVTIGYATHGLLDAFTSYGTLLWWPFSQTRVAWDAVGIIDLFFTLPLFLGVILSAWQKRARPAILTLCYCAFYLSLGLVQNHRAFALQEITARQRGHELTRGRVLPTVGNLALWHSIYAEGDQIHVDRIKVPFLAPPTVRSESVLQKFSVTAFETISPNPKVQQALATFTWFADDYVFVVQDNPLILGDARYLGDPAKGQPLWGLQISSDQTEPKIAWVRFPFDRSRLFKSLWRNLMSRD